MASQKGQFVYTITKQKDKWVVVPESTDKADLPRPGCELVWMFGKGLQYEGLEAHFQFCDHVPNNDKICILDSQQLNADWAGSIPDHVSGEVFRATLREGVPPGDYHYALWMVDPQAGKNDFAIGDNPPPKMQTGG